METTNNNNGNGQSIVMRNPELTFALCDRLGLMWAAKKEELKREVELPSGKRYDATGVHAIVRQDTGRILGVGTDAYEPFQNWELAEIVSRIAETKGATVESGGLLDHGAKVFIQFGIQDFKINGDIIKRWITGLSSHDLSLTLKWGEQGTRVVCQNTFMMAYRSLTTGIKHTRNMRAIIEQSLLTLDKIEQEDKSLLELLNSMLSATATDEQIGKVVKLVTDVDAKMPRTQVIREQSSRKYNSAVKLVDAIATEINGVGKNLFGVWNGVTRYTTHDASGTIEGRLKSKMIGNLQKTDESILEAMRELIQKGSGVLA